MGKRVCSLQSFMILGLAHGISAMILRWTAQAIVSAAWMVGGLACYVVSNQWLEYLFRGRDVRWHGAVRGCMRCCWSDGVRVRQRSMAELRIPELDPVVHGKLRLAALSLLLTVEEADFTWLREKTGSTDGTWGRRC